MCIEIHTALKCRVTKGKNKQELIYVSNAHFTAIKIWEEALKFESRKLDNKIL